MGIFAKKKSEDIDDIEVKKNSKKKAVSDTQEKKEVEMKEEEKGKIEEKGKRGKKEEKKGKKETRLNSAKSILIEKTIIKPWISEKAGVLAMEGKYIFKVSKNAAKHKIKDAVESLYKTSVTDVNVVNIPGKPKQSKSRRTIHRANYRKAIVTLKPGEKIEVF